LTEVAVGDVVVEKNDVSRPSSSSSSSSSKKSSKFASNMAILSHSYFFFFFIVVFVSFIDDDLEEELDFVVGLVSLFVSPPLVADAVIATVVENFESLTFLFFVLA
jgi:hypothetical protein